MTTRSRAPSFSAFTTPGCKVITRLFMRRLRFFGLMWAGLFMTTLHSHSQAMKEETLSGPDTHETGTGPHGHLLGDWGGERTRLEEKGVNFDLQYISDSLWNIKSEQKERLANWSRVRGTVDINFGSLNHQDGLYFHATALWQGGRQTRTVPGSTCQPERHVQRKYLSA